MARLRQSIAVASGCNAPLRISLAGRLLPGAASLREAGLSDGVCIDVLRHANQRVATASTDKTVKIWCCQTGDCLMTLTDHGNQVMSVCFSPDGQLLASSSTDHTAKIWCGETGECLNTLLGQ